MTTSPAPIDLSGHHTMTLEEAIIARHSTRRFLSTPVPRPIVERALALAKHAPSNSNIQPWKLYILCGPAADRLKTALVAEAQSGAHPAIPALPDAFKHFRSELGKEVYGEGLGIPHDDAEGRAKAVLRNFDFFGAPIAAVVCIDKRLSKPDVLSVGMYLQTFLVALTEDGVASCVEVSVAGYPEVIRKVVGMPEEMDIICGVAIGYQDDENNVNHLTRKRTAVEETTVIMDE